jgi:hypothetical protein
MYNSYDCMFKTPLVTVHAFLNQYGRTFLCLNTDCYTASAKAFTSVPKTIRRWFPNVLLYFRFLQSLYKKFLTSYRIDTVTRLTFSALPKRYIDLKPTSLALCLRFMSDSVSGMLPIPCWYSEFGACTFPHTKLLESYHGKIYTK